MRFSKVQLWFVYLFAFSVTFETADLFYLGIDYLATKITVVLLLIVSLVNVRTSFYARPHKKYLFPIFLFFIYLCLISYLNGNPALLSFFYFPFFLNLLIFTIFLSLSTIYPYALQNCLLILVFCSCLISIFYLLGIGVTESTHEGRIRMFNMNENMLGLNICFSLLTSLWAILNKYKIQYYKKLILVIMTPFLLYLMIQTGSRVAFLSFLLGVFMFAIGNKRDSSIRKISIFIILVINGILAWFFLIKNSSLVNRIVSTLNEGDLSNRDLIWMDLFQVISNNYIFGIGITGYLNQVGEMSPHNVLIEILCYTGIIGLILFLVFLFRIIKIAYQNYKSSVNTLQVALLIPVIGMILTGQILEQKIVWLILAYVVTGIGKDADNRELTSKYFLNS